MYIHVAIHLVCQCCCVHANVYVFTCTHVYHVHVHVCVCTYTRLTHVHVGWKVQWSDGELVFYMLHKTAAGLHVTYSITVRSAFLYSITYRGHYIDMKDCTALNDVSASVDSGIMVVVSAMCVIRLAIHYFTVSKVIYLLDRLSGSHLCVGNGDEVFLNLPNIRNGVLRDQSSKLGN